MNIGKIQGIIGAVVVLVAFNKLGAFGSDSK